MKKKRLIYFTSSYPYGLGESWKTNELEVFAKQFEEIIIIPFSYGGNFTAKVLPYKNIVVSKPVMEKDPGLKGYIFSFLFSRRLFNYLSLFIKEKAFLRSSRLINWFNACFQADHTFDHPVVKDIMTKKNMDTVLFFFWGCESAYIVPFLKKDNFDKIVVRYNGYDLYEERQKGYIPFRKAQLQNLTRALTVSENGKQYLIHKFPEQAFKIEKRILGTKECGNSLPGTDGILRIVSCSSLIPLKRVHLIVGALMKLDLDVEWTHIGGGPLMEEIKQMCNLFPSNIHYTITGTITPQEVMDYYDKKIIDIFINVSETEGLPVSVMEALSAGVPVYATNVGGTGEIVNSSNGKLLTASVTSEELAEELKRFHDLNAGDISLLRKNAKETFFRNCNATILAESLCDFLVQ